MLHSRLLTEPNSVCTTQIRYPGSYRAYLTRLIDARRPMDEAFATVLICGIRSRVAATLESDGADVRKLVRYIVGHINKLCYFCQ